jgi:tripartite-type tricarboxylate transporter receptor subunit TctC
MKIPRRNFLGLAAGAAALPAVSRIAWAQAYPTRPVRIFVGFVAGSGPDILARAVAGQLTKDVGHNFFIENRTGANGTMAIRATVEAAPDGYSLLFSSPAISTTPFLYKNAPAVLQDLAQIATVGILDGYLVLVNPAMPVRSVTELIAYARNTRVLYGSPGIGNGLHLVAELFNVKTGLSMEHVPFRGAAEVLTALMQGSIQVMFVTPTAAVPLVKEGKLRAIGFTGTKPFPEFPDVPLVTASVQNFPPTGSWGMFFAPASTPPSTIDRLNQDIQRALQVPAVAEVIQRAGYEPDGRSAAQTAEFFRREVALAGEAVRAAGIQPN